MAGPDSGAMRGDIAPFCQQIPPVGAVTGIRHGLNPMVRTFPIVMVRLCESGHRNHPQHLVLKEVGVLPILWV